jgi:hypothetical protein
MASRKLGRRLTIMERLRKRFRRIEQPDVFPVVNFYQPVYPGK